MDRLGLGPATPGGEPLGWPLEDARAVFAGFETCADDTGADRLARVKKLDTLAWSEMKGQIVRTVLCDPNWHARPCVEALARRTSWVARLSG